MIQGSAYRAPFSRVVVRKQFSDLFPSEEFNSYSAFVTTSGECLKSEPRTRVVRFERRRPGAEAKERFIIKEYYYPFLPRTRTWYHHSKAEHEFKSLQKVAELGVHAAEPVAFGVRRSIAGCVHSCFIITRYVENAITLEQWADETQLCFPKPQSNWPVCQSLGRTFRTLHLARFFLFTAKPQSILIRRTEDSFEPVLIDLPYALRVRWRYFARYAQALDLAVFLGNVAPLLPQYRILPFYSGYLPDPLGGIPGDLEQRLADAIRWRRNETPVSRVVHKLRRSAKEYGRWLIGQVRMPKVRKMR